MKRCRYVLSILLAAAMAFAPCASSFAAGSNMVMITDGKAMLQTKTNLSSEKKYAVTLAKEGQGKISFKTVKETLTTAKPGEKVTLLVKGSKGYVAEGLTVTSTLKNTKLNTSFKVVGDEYTFTMPEQSVTIKAKFVKGTGSTTEKAEKTTTAKATVKTEEKTTVAKTEEKATVKKTEEAKKAATTTEAKKTASSRNQVMKSAPTSVAFNTTASVITGVSRNTIMKMAGSDLTSVSLGVENTSPWGEKYGDGTNPWMTAYYNAEIHYSDGTTGYAPAYCAQPANGSPLGSSSYNGAHPNRVNLSASGGSVNQGSANYTYSIAAYNNDVLKIAMAINQYGTDAQRSKYLYNGMDSVYVSTHIIIGMLYTGDQTGVSGSRLVAEQGLINQLRDLNDNHRIGNVVTLNDGTTIDLSNYNLWMITTSGSTQNMVFLGKGENPQIVGTVATSTISGNHYAYANGSVTINDVVQYSGLTPNQPYTLKARLVTPQGNDIASTTHTFTPTAAAGSTTVSIPAFDGWALAGTNAIMFEDLYNGNDTSGNVISSHQNGADLNQTIHFPKLATEAKDSETGTHYSNADGSVTINDKVDYWNLDTSTTYHLKGYLVDKATGTTIAGSSGEIDFKPADVYGSVTVPITCNDSTLAGKNVVVYEELSVGNIMYAEHKDGNDANQFIHFPKIGTEAKDSDTQTHYSNADGSVTINDKVEYWNLDTNTTYHLKGYLVDKATGNPIAGSLGEVDFKPTAANGSQDVAIKVDASTLAGKDVVAYEELSVGTDMYAEHKDKTDTSQLIHFPKIGTTATSPDSNGHFAVPDTSVTINDTVAYENLDAGKTYTVKGVLKDKATGNDAVDAAGNVIKAEKTFQATAANGTVDLTFTFDGSKLAGTSVVAFETVYLGDKIYAEHKDINDEGQTVNFPEIKTKAVDAKGNNTTNATEEITVVDTVTYKNLQVNKEYTLTGKLMNKETGQPAKDDAGNEITAEQKFTPTTTNGSTIVTFKFSGVKLAGTRLVAFETLKLGNTLYGSHEDLEDEDQTVYVPKIATQAKDKEIEEYSCADEDVEITDTVTYEKLKVGQEYNLSATLYDKDTGKVMKDGAGKELKATATFKPTTMDGTQDVKFHIVNLANTLKDKTVVVYEELRFGTGTDVVATHKDINDMKQTITFPEIRTHAADDLGEHVTKEQEKITVIDIVSYEKLKPNQEYTVSGTLMDKATGQPAKDSDGKVIKASTTFTPTTPNGNVQVTFEFNGASMKGTTLVAFETVSHEGKNYAVHADLNDEDQTHYIPEIKTTATNKATGEHMVKADANVTIQDVVSYTDLKAGKEYTMTGVLMNKKTGKPLVDANGKEVTATKTFTPAKTTGSVTLDFTFNASKLEGVTVVAFETLSNGKDIEYATHADIEDKAQTVFVPKIRTTIVDKDTKVNVIESTKESVTLVDTVKYENLVPGKSYEVSGKLMDKETGEVVKDAAGKEITAATKFTPTDASGSVDVTFPPIDATKAPGKTYVAFEDLTLNGTSYATHADIEDVDQSAYVPKIRTHATDRETETNVSKADKKVTIIDRVTYKGLRPGVEYTMKAKLMNKANGKPALDNQGKEITAEQKFTPEKSSGSVDVTFSFDGLNLAGSTVVAFEDLQYKDVSYATHADLEDEDQTVTIPKIATQAVDKETGVNVVYPTKKVTVVDKIDYENLKVGESYTVTGKLMDKETGETALDSDGAAITASKTFTCSSVDGSIEVEFTFNATDMNGQTLVAYEELGQNKKVYAAHCDMNDKAQTIYVNKDNLGEETPTTGDEYFGDEEASDNADAGAGSGSGTPYGNSPATGDSNRNIAMMAGLMVLAIGAAGIVIYKKKKED